MFYEKICENWLLVFYLFRNIGVGGGGYLYERFKVWGYCIVRFLVVNLLIWWVIFLILLWVLYNGYYRGFFF